MNTQSPHPLPTAKRSAHVAGTGPVPSACTLWVVPFAAFPAEALSRSPDSSGSPVPCPLSPKRKAFTLVELLVVITIISILAALATVGVMRALDTAKNTRIKMEVDLLDAAMKAFKLEYGSYPPCDLRCTSSSAADNDPTAAKYYNLPLRQFLSRAFPRYPHNGPGSGSLDRLMFDLSELSGSNQYLTHEFHPDRALVIWLSRLSADTTSPFAVDGPRRTPFFEFDKTRLYAWNDSLPTPAYVPATDTSYHGLIIYTPPSSKVPYVYFDNRAYLVLKTTSGSKAASFPFGTNNFAVPYAHDMNANGMLNSEGFTDSNGNGTYDDGEALSDPNSNKRLDLVDDTWANPDSFQIISAGQDGLFSGTNSTKARVRLFPTGKGYDPEDRDNITNFTEKVTLEDAIP